MKWMEKFTNIEIPKFNNFQKSPTHLYHKRTYFLYFFIVFKYVIYMI